MKKRVLKHIRIALLTVLALGALLYVPWFLQTRPIPFDPAGLVAPKRAEHQGVLTVWALGGWNTPYGSRVTLLQEAARRYEKGNIGSYVEVIQMDNAQFERALARGDRPDILSIPAGFVYGLPWELAPQPPYALRAPFEMPENSAFVPWIASGKVLLCNLELCEKQDLPQTLTDGTALLAALNAHQKEEPLLYGSGISWLSPLSAGKDWADYLLQAPLQAQYAQAWPAFRAGGSPYYIGGYYEKNILTVRLENGNGFRFAYGWPEEWQMVLDVHYAAVVAKDAVHDGACRNYLDELLGIKTQTAIVERLGCIPVVALNTEEFNASEKSTYALAEKAAVLPAGIRMDETALRKWIQEAAVR